MSKNYSDKHPVSVSKDPFGIVFQKNKVVPVGYIDRLSNLPSSIYDQVTLADGTPMYREDAPDLFELIEYNFNTSLAPTGLFALPNIKNEKQAQEFNAYWLDFVDSTPTQASIRKDILEQADEYAESHMTKNSTPSRQRTISEDEQKQIKKMLDKLLHESVFVEEGPKERVKEQTEKPDLQALLQKLDNMIGLQNVKDHVHRLVAFHQVIQARQEQGIQAPQVSNHLAFEGPPGTGKTTVARLIADIYFALGVTKTNKFVETDRSGLVGQYIGATASKTTKKIKEAMGGVLFIDEAYALATGGGDRRDFGNEAISTLLKAMEDHRDNLVVIFAGYSNEMEMLWKSNSGLRSRVPSRNKIPFQEYSAKELGEIASDIAKDNVYTLSECAKEKIVEIAESLQKDPQFGNGRWARDLVETSILNHALRIQKDGGDLQKIMAEDVEYVEHNEDQKSFGFAI